MFGFAQFAHFLPYILLAITSFAGITGYTLNYTQKKVVKESTPEVVKEVQFETKTKQAKIAEFAFIETELYLHEIQTTYQYTSVINEYPPGRSAFYLCNVLCLHTFQRPPPVTILS